MSDTTLFKGPAIGLGTWQMGERAGQTGAEVSAITHALERGARLIDTAEMYANGESERRVGDALKRFGLQRRHELTIVTKVLPGNASRSGTLQACEDSLRRLGLDYVDIYLLHWQGSHPYEQTLEAFALLRERGLIRHWGVSNFDLASLQRWIATEERLGLDDGCATNQIYYSLMARGPEFDLLPAMTAIGMPAMAYTPLGSGDLARHPQLTALAKTTHYTAAQLALAWTVRSGNVVAIPKSSRPERINDNLDAADLRLSEAVLKKIDELFPPPTRKIPLAMV